MSAAKTKAQNIIDENAVGMYPQFAPRIVTYGDADMKLVAVFSKSYCPYCKATKSLLDQIGAKYFSIELDQVGMLCHFTFSRGHRR